MLVAEYKERNGSLILQLKGKLDGSSVIQLGTFLGEVANSHITHLTLDFSQVLDFEYTGIGLSTAILEFYIKDFSEIKCCGFSQSISNVFKGFGAHKISGLKIVPIDEPKDPAVSDL